MFNSIIQMEAEHLRETHKLRNSCLADRLLVVVRFPASPRLRLKTADPPKGNGLGQKKTGDPIFWDHVWVHFLKFVVSRLQKRNVFNEAPQRAEGKLGRPF